MQSFHPDLERYLKSCFDFEVKMLNDATKEGNKSIEELKRGSAIKKLNELSEESSEAHRAIKKTMSDSNVLEQKKERLEEQIEALEKKLDLLNTSSEKVDKIQAKKSLLGNKVSIAE